MLTTDRLILRQWQDKDLPAFAALNADPVVMQYFPETLSRQQSDAMAEKAQSLIAERGWGFWAVEHQADGAFIGLVGLHQSKEQLPFSPCVEVGWRLAKAYWGKGFASEAAQKSLEFAFTQLGLDAVASFTTIANARSRAVMQRLGMTDTGQNFAHPDVPKDHVLSEHALYKIKQITWNKLAADADL